VVIAMLTSPSAGDGRFERELAARSHGLRTPLANILAADPLASGASQLMGVQRDRLEVIRLVRRLAEFTQRTLGAATGAGDQQPR
jgi:hypothetical protein